MWIYKKLYCLYLIYIFFKGFLRWNIRTTHKPTNPIKTDHASINYRNATENLSKASSVKSKQIDAHGRKGLRAKDLAIWWLNSHLNAFLSACPVTPPRRQSTDKGWERVVTLSWLWRHVCADFGVCVGMSPFSKVLELIKYFFISGNLRFLVWGKNLI